MLLQDNWGTGGLLQIPSPTCSISLEILMMMIKELAMAEYVSLKMPQEMNESMQIAVIDISLT